MFLDRIKSKDSGILLYGITPPKDQTEPERVIEIAEKTLERLHLLDIDALVVYDVQDESARTDEERPFPFLKALDPFEFAKEHLQSLNIPKIIYRPAGKFTKQELDVWVNELVLHGFFPVFVGVPAPDFVPITTLNEAYEIWRKYNEISAVGAVTIPERHAVLNDEQDRMLDKMSNGVSYFISQCIFNVDYAKRVIDDLEIACASLGQDFPTVIFTLTACGSKKTLRFMEWLGIHIPETLKEELMASENILNRSVEICMEIADELIKYCSEKNIPFGFNIESVAIRKEEIEASILMTNQIGAKLKELGIRK
ncbi:MAG: methylenetetrahydrofolate reductase [Bacteroidota bacterium]